MKLYIAYAYGNNDMPYILGIGTDFENAEKIIHENYSGELIELEKGSFKKPDSSETDFYIQEVKANTLLH